MAEETLNATIVKEAFSTGKIYLVLIGVAAAVVPIVTALVAPFA